jgi:hypothetical protein
MNSETRGETVAPSEVNGVPVDPSWSALRVTATAGSLMRNISTT